MTYPHIKLLRSPFGFYFYEVNRNEIVSIDGDVYRLLEDVLKGRLTMEDVAASDTRVQDIVQKGYLSEKRVTTIRHSASNDLRYYLDRKMEKITLQLTQDCNFRCKYCAYSGSGEGQRTHKNATMSFAMACRAIDFLHDHSGDSPEVDVGLYGGEPLLEFDLIKHIVEYADEKFEGRNLSYSMTTNGSILRPDIIEFCLKHKISVIISIDGPKEIHDKNRRLANGEGSTFDLVVHNLQLAQKQYPEFLQQIRINMVTDPTNDADCANQLFMDYDFFSRDRATSTIVDTKYTVGNYDATADFRVKSIYNIFLAFMHHFRRIDKERVSPLALTILIKIIGDKERMQGFQALPDVMAPGGPCLPGVLRAFVDIHGNLFPCERCSELASVMCIGSLDKGFDLHQANKILNIGALTEEECRNCWAITKCSVCAAQIEDGNSFSSQKKAKKCLEVRYAAEQELLDFVMLHEMTRILNKKGEFVYDD